MRAYLLKVLQEYPFQKTASDEIIRVYDLIIANTQTNCLLTEVLVAYEEDINCDEKKLNEKVAAIAELLNIHLFSVRLVAILCLSKKLKMRLIEKGISAEIIYRTIADVVGKSWETYDVYQVVGVSGWSWFFGFLRLERFGIGRLQFEMAKFRLPFYEKDGRIVTDEDMVVNVHIPRSDIPFTPEECDKAYRAAKEFFAPHFKDGIVPFVCWSWLLYPKNREILPEKSNVVQFLSRYDIIEMEEYTEAYNPVSHILFNREKMGDISTLPKDTSMRKRYAEFLQNGGQTGWGYGIFFL